MSKQNCKALPYTITHEPENQYEVAWQETRYRIVDIDTGEILDDAQGYGYKTPQKAHAAWGYKTRDKSKDGEKRRKRQKIERWLRDHKDFELDMEEYEFEIEGKHSWEPDDHFDTAFVRQMLKERNLEPDFTAGDLLYVWKKYRR